MTEENTTTESENQATEETAVDTIIYDDGVDNTTATEENTVDNGQKQEVVKEETTGEQSETKPINQEAVDKKINKVVFERYEEKRKREEAERKLVETQQQLEQLQKPKDGLQIEPPMPDPLEFGYDEKVVQRDAIIKSNAKITARDSINNEMLVKQHQEQIDKIKADSAKLNDSMYDKAAELGFSNEEFGQSDKRVALFIKDGRVIDYILKNENAPLIVQYLAQNLPEMERISQMDSVNAAVHIASAVLPQAVKLKPSTTKTPDPLNLPKGKGAGDKESPFLEGVQLE